MSDGPYFSIGVTTFDRRDLLAETLSSILSQTFNDFEVIVGNDNTEVPLTLEMLGVNDSRVRIINHVVNLGEIGNMSALLAESRGRYFTWLADDDLYNPDFLRAVRDAHDRCNSPPCVYTGYTSGTTYNYRRVDYAGNIRSYSGRDFLREYLARHIQVLGCCGVFDTQYLRWIGGMEQLGRGFSPYSDNLVAIKVGLAETLCYVDAPLIFFRTHPGSASFSNPNLYDYVTAQKDLCSRALKIFGSESLQQDMQKNLYNLLSYWCLTFTFHVLERPHCRHYPGFTLDYIRFFGKCSRALKGARFKLIIVALALLIRYWTNTIWRLARNGLSKLYFH